MIKEFQTCLATFCPEVFFGIDIRDVHPINRAAAGDDPIAIEIATLLIASASNTSGPDFSVIEASDFEYVYSSSFNNKEAFIDHGLVVFGRSDDPQEHYLYRRSDQCIYYINSPVFEPSKHMEHLDSLNPEYCYRKWTMQEFFPWAVDLATRRHQDLQGDIVKEAKVARAALEESIKA